MEVVALVRTYGHEAGAHLEAVEVAGDGAVHVCQFVGVEVVARGEREVPPFGGLHTSAETEVLGDFSAVVELFVVTRAV